MDKDYLEEENIQIHCILYKIQIVNQLHTSNLQQKPTHQVLVYHYIGEKGKKKVRDDMNPRLLNQVLEGKFAIRTIFYPTHCCKLSHSSWDLS